MHAFAPDEEGVVGLDAVVVTTDGKGEFLRFDPAAGFQVGVGLFEEAGPVVHAEEEKAAVDVVEGARKDPGFFDVVDFEFAVGRDPKKKRSEFRGRVLREDAFAAQGGGRSWGTGGTVSKRDVFRQPYQEGWMGERSVPRTCAWGYFSANSMAHIPVPVPTSRTLTSPLRGIGARWRLPFNDNRHISC